MLREFHEDSERRHEVLVRTLATNHQESLAMFKEAHRLGQAIVKALIQQSRTLDNHSTLLKSIDHKLGARDNGQPGANGPRL